MSIPFRTIAAGAPSSASALTRHYLTQTLAAEDLVLANYYERSDGLGVLRPDMAAHVAQGLGLTLGQALSRDQINALIAGRRADGEVIEGKHYAPKRALPVKPSDRVQRHSTPIGSVDFTVSPGKSIQVAYGFGNPLERAAIYAAHIEAARFAVGHVTEERGTIRLGKGGLKGTLPADTTWIEFTHRTERKSAGDKSDLPPDPGLHTHFVVMAATFGADGKVGSFDTGQLEGTTFAADAAYHARFAQNLRDAGFDAELDPLTGAAEMPIIPKGVRTLFSKRSSFGEDLARQYTEAQGERWSDLTDAQRTARTKAATQSKDQKIFAKEDGLTDVASWRAQATDQCGWEAPPLQRTEPPQPGLPQAEKDRIALEVARDYLAERFEQRSVIPDWELKIAAGRGWVKAGLSDAADIDRVIGLMRTEGIRHNGAKHTELLFVGEEGRRFESVTTAKHDADEREFVHLVATASQDRSSAIPADLLERKIAESGLDFTDDHGKAQLAAIHKLGRGGRFGLLVAASGSGKSTALKPLVAAWDEMGCTVFGTSLGSRQSDALADTGIRPDRLKATSVLLDSIAEGSVKLGRRSVVVIDEASQLGTLSGLRLLRAQAKHGFAIVAIGDNKQTSAIEAGNFISLAERGIGPAPRIETTRRQASTREKEIARLFRAGQAADALDMKRADGTALMIPGSRGDVIDAVAHLYADRLRATGQAPSITAPTNQDAHEISAAVRRERRAMGLIGADQVTLKATDGVRSYDLPLAKGDHVRLFKNTRPAGVGRGGSIGRNQSVLEVVGIAPDGITMKNAKGRVALVHLSELTDKPSGRVLLAYGTSLTVHSGQGITSQEHINALPAGSKGIDGKSLYSGNTRHVHAGYLVTSGDAEMRAVRASRPVNDPHEITLEDKWANVAQAMANQPEKDTALALFDRALAGRQGATAGLGSAMPPTGHRAAARAPEVVQRRRIAAPARLLTGPDDQVRRERRSMRSAAERPKTPRPTPRRDRTDAVAEFSDALRQAGFRLKGQPVMDGQWHRVQVEGDRGRKMSGRYRGYLDGLPAGFIENFKTGEANAWRSDRPMPALTAEQHRQREADRVARESERLAAENAAAARAFGIWSNAKPATRHDYLTRKAVRAYDVRQTASGDLVVPMRDGGGWVRNVQTIKPDGEKRFVAGARKTGLYGQIGEIDPAQPLLIAEGYATAASLHEASGLPVIVAFDAGNLKPVAEAIRAKYPEVQMVFAADNDWHLPQRDNPLPNIGREKAEAAAQAVGGKVIVPSFDEHSQDKPLTDWNDYAVTNGRIKMQQEIRDQLKSQGIKMEEKTTPTISQAQRDAARAASSSKPETAAQRSAQQHQQEQQRLSESRGLTR